MSQKADYKNGLAEISQIMHQHIADRGNSDTVNLIWAGFLAGLMVQGYFEPDDYHDLNDKLKNVGRDELGELFIGIPDGNDQADAGQ